MKYSTILSALETITKTAMWSLSRWPPQMNYIVPMAIVVTTNVMMQIGECCYRKRNQSAACRASCSGHTQARTRVSTQGILGTYSTRCLGKASRLVIVERYAYLWLHPHGCAYIHSPTNTHVHSKYAHIVACIRYVNIK